MEPLIHLRDKVAIVTGASRGIGESIARTFASHGAKVVLASRKIEGLEAVAASIRQDGGDAFAKACHTDRGIRSRPSSRPPWPASARSTCW